MSVDENRGVRLPRSAQEDEEYIKSGQSGRRVHSYKLASLYLCVCSEEEEGLTSLHIERGGSIRNYFQSCAQLGRRRKSESRGNSDGNTGKGEDVVLIHPLLQVVVRRRMDG